MTARPVVVVGNGMAGSRVADEIARRAAADLSVTVLGDEQDAAYNRVLLSSVLAGDAAVEDVYLPTPGRAGNGVTVRPGTRVTRVDRDAREVLTADGGRAPYDTLVLATGSKAVVPPLSGLFPPDGPDELLPGVTVFRTLQDCRTITAAAAGARRAVVLGGGLLGVEAARGLVARGLDVEVLHAAPHLMERQLDASAAGMLASTLESLGVTTHVGARVVAVRGDARVRGVVLDDGTVVEADVLVVACGVRPDTALAEQAGLHVDRGVVVDDALRSVTDPDVYALGDCAQHDGQVYGLVAPAWEQAVVVADRVTGADATACYRGSRHVARLKAAGVEVASLGDPCDDAAEVVQFVDSARGKYQKLVVRDDRLVGAILLGETGTVGTLTQLYDRGAPVPADRRTLLFPRLASTPVVESPAHLPSDARICQCNGVTKADVRDSWLSGARTVDDVAAATRATTGCGGCRDAVEGVVTWLESADPDPPAERARPEAVSA
ncbi:MAG: FAD-dependent oxidoreductase [Actinomycetes bacterium]